MLPENSYTFNKVAGYTTNKQKSVITAYRDLHVLGYILIKILLQMLIKISAFYLEVLLFPKTQPTYYRKTVENLELRTDMWQMGMTLRKGPGHKINSPSWRPGTSL